MIALIIFTALVVFVFVYALSNRRRPQVQATKPADVATEKTSVSVSESSDSEERRQSPTEGAVAVVGLSINLPGANSLEAFWENISAGKHSIGRVPKNRWDWHRLGHNPQGSDTAVDWGGFIEGVDQFDPLFFGISAREAEAMDPQQRLLLMHAWKAIEDAGYAPSSLSGSNTAVVIGTASSGYSQRNGGNTSHIEGYSSTASVASVGPNRVSYFLNLSGPSEPVETACSSSLVAIHRAVKLIQSGDCQAALAGGISTIVHPDMHVSFTKAGMLSKDGKCKTFSKDADGYVRGEGSVVLMLKSLERAQRDKDDIYGVIIGSGENHGGRANSLTAPNPKAQAQLIKTVTERAGVEIDSISYIEAHGTGTKLGDPIEIRSLTKAYGDIAQAQNKTLGHASLGIGSVKTNIGHLELASGAAGLAKVLMQMRHQEIAPSLNCREENPFIKFDKTPFYVAKELTSWSRRQDSLGNLVPLRAGVSSFGFGGVNAHVIVEEGPKLTEQEMAKGPFVIILSAKNEAALDRSLNHFHQWIEGRDLSTGDLDRIAYTLQVGRDEMDSRFGVLVSDLDQLITILKEVVDQPDRKRRYHYHTMGRDVDVVTQLNDDDGFAAMVKQWITSGRYENVLKVWAKGAKVDWLEIYRQRPTPARIHLPTYSFAAESYWLEMDYSQYADVDTESENTARIYTPEWKPSSLIPSGKKALGQRAILICSLEPEPLSEAVLLEGELRAEFTGAEMSFVRIPNDVRVAGDQYGDSVIDTALKVFEFLKQQLQSKATRNNLTQIVLIGPQTAVGMFNAAVAMLRTVTQENPNWVGQLICMEDNVLPLAQILHQESFYGDSSEVLYRSGRRYCKQWRELEQVHLPDNCILKSHGLYLVSGGLGKLGRIVAKYLAETVEAPTIILLGRGEISADGTKFVRSLKGLGARLSYQRVNIQRREETQRLMSALNKRELKINGVFHCAGVLDDGYALTKEPESFAKVVSTKVKGLLNLDQATGDQNLDFFVCYSSIAGVFGNVGQIDYAFANAAMDQFAWLRNARAAAGERRGHTLSINWPHWLEGGMHTSQPNIDEYQWQGLVKLPTELGLMTLQRCLNGDDSQYLVNYGVSLGELLAENQRISREVERATEVSAAVDPSAALMPLTQNLCQLLSRVTKFPVAKIEVQEPFSAYGLDSIMINSLNRELEVIYPQLSKTLFFEYTTIAELAGYLVSSYPGETQSWVKETSLAVSSSDSTATKISKNPSKPFAPESSLGAAKISEDEIPLLPPTAVVKRTHREPIAIIGLAGRYPKADSIDAFWDVLARGRDCITTVPSERWDMDAFYESDPDEAVLQQKSYSKWGGFVNDFACFDPLFFGISPKEARSMDPQERLFLQTCWEAIEDAGYSRKGLAESCNGKVGVYAGVTKTGYELYRAEVAENNGSAGIMPVTSFSSIANRVSYVFNFTGPSMPIDTMCSSSLTAIHQACEHIGAGECEIAIAGGVNLYLHPANYVTLSAKRMLSPDGRCKSFGEGGNGFVPGEGVGAVLLKPLSKAMADRDHIYGLVKSTSINHGGHTNGYTVPSPNAQASLIESAIRKAALHSNQVSYIEAHGTGTELGDPIEVSGLSKAFAATASDSLPKRTCALGSVKSNIGHLEAAAGIAGMTKILLQLKHKQIVPSLHSETLNRNIDFSGNPFSVQTRLGEWTVPVSEDGVSVLPRCAGISSFGAGGANAHVLVEEFPQQASQPIDSRSRLFVLSARTSEQLLQVAQRLAEHLKRSDIQGDVDLERVAYTLLTGRERMSCRAAIIAENEEQLLDGLEQFIQGSPDSPYILTKDGHQNPRAVEDLNEEERGEHERAVRWIHGEEIEWQEGAVQRLSLPTYPFEKRQLWIKPMFKREASKESNERENSGSAQARELEKATKLADRPTTVADLKTPEINQNAPLSVSGESVSLTPLMSIEWPASASANSDAATFQKVQLLHIATGTEPDARQKHVGAGKPRAASTKQSAIKRSDVLEDLKAASGMSGMVPTLNRTGVMLEEITQYSRAFCEYAGHCSGKVLDIGCAYGVATLGALELGASVVAVDMEQSHLDILMERVTPEMKHRVETRRGLIPDIDFEPNSFDAIHASRVIHFLKPEDVQYTLEKMFEWLTPGGKIFITSDSPFFGYWASRSDVYLEKRQRGESWPGYIEDVSQYFDPKFTAGGPNLINPLDPDVLSRECKRIGLEVDCCGYFDAGKLSENHPEHPYHGMEHAGIVASKPAQARNFHSAFTPDNSATFVTRHGDSIRYFSIGDARNTVVFVHGLGCDHTVWIEQVAAFSASHRVVVIDIPGHGASQDYSKPWTIEGCAEDIAELIAGLGSDPVNLVGHSVGSSLVIETARSLGPRVRSVVCVESLHDLDFNVAQNELDAHVAKLTENDGFFEGMFAVDDTSGLKNRVFLSRRCLNRNTQADIFKQLIDYQRHHQSFGDLNLTLINSSRWMPTNLEAARRSGISVKLINNHDHFPMVTQSSQFNRLLSRALSKVTAELSIDDATAINYELSETV